MDLLTQLNQKFDKTIVMVTHDPNAASFADDVHHLEKGVLLPKATASFATKGIT